MTVTSFVIMIGTLSDVPSSGKKASRRLKSLYSEQRYKPGVAEIRYGGRSIA